MESLYVEWQVLFLLHQVHYMYKLSISKKRRHTLGSVLVCAKAK